MPGSAAIRPAGWRPYAPSPAGRTRHTALPAPVLSASGNHNDGYLSWTREAYRYQHHAEAAIGSADEPPNLVSHT